MPCEHSGDIIIVARFDDYVNMSSEHPFDQFGFQNGFSPSLLGYL